MGMLNIDHLDSLLPDASITLGLKPQLTICTWNVSFKEGIIVGLQGEK